MRFILGGSWVVISRVISPLIGVITIVILLITSLITTHEPPSRGCLRFQGGVLWILRVKGSGFWPSDLRLWA